MEVPDPSVRLGCCLWADVVDLRKLEHAKLAEPAGSSAASPASLVNLEESGCAHESTPCFRVQLGVWPRVWPLCEGVKRLNFVNSQSHRCVMMFRIEQQDE